MDTRQQLFKTIRNLELMMNISRPASVRSMKILFDITEEGDILVGMLKMAVETLSGIFILEDMAVTEVFTKESRREAENSIIEDALHILTRYIDGGEYDFIWEKIDLDKECWKK